MVGSAMLLIFIIERLEHRAFEFSHGNILQGQSGQIQQSSLYTGGAYVNTERVYIHVLDTRM